MACALVCRAWVRRSRHHLFRQNRHFGHLHTHASELSEAVTVFAELPWTSRSSSLHLCNLQCASCTLLAVTIARRITPSRIGFRPLIAQLHLLVSVDTLVFGLHHATVPYCEGIISAAPSFAAKITRLVLAVDCQGSSGEREMDGDNSFAQVSCPN